MSFSVWLALIGAWIAALALPGPDIFIILRLAVRERRAAVLAALGIMTGNLLWITVSVLGITAILRAYPFILPGIQIFGIVVLGYLGWQSVRSGVAQMRQGADAQTARQSSNPWLLGLITNLANPKALIFFTALLGQFVPPGSSWVTSLVIITVMVLVGLAWFVSLAVASSAAAFRIWFKKAAPWLDVVAGALFLIVAALIAFEVAGNLLSLF